LKDTVRGGFRRSLILFVLLASLPALVGMFLAVAYRLGWIENQIVYLRATLDILSSFVGILISILAFICLGIALAINSRSKRQIMQIHEQAGEERRQFLLRLDHEMKTPLTTLQLEIANLKTEMEGELSGLQSPEDGAESGAPAERLEEQIERLSRLGTQLRKLAELETHPLEKETVDLAGLLQELASEFREAGGGRQIDLVLPQVPWPLPSVEVDLDLIHLAFHNLFSNAVKFTRPDDEIQVRAFESSQDVVVEMADSGPGIPKSELPHLWEELYRGKLARGLPGSGLGLSLVKAIIERHGGQVSIRSRLNKGTVLTVRIPARL
jgi:two-component system, OmpR family, sensor kinase